MKLQASALSLLGVALALCAAAPASAQSAGTSVPTLSLDDASLFGLPGQNILFTGQIADTPTDALETGEPLTLAVDSSSILPADATVDDSPYINYSVFSPNAPITLNPNQSTGSIGLFDVDLPTTAIPGTTYTGTFEVDATDPNGNTVPGGSQAFSVTVESAAAVPEPGSYPLLALGLPLVGLMVRRRTARRA